MWDALTYEGEAGVFNESLYFTYIPTIDRIKYAENKVVPVFKNHANDTHRKGGITPRHQVEFSGNRRHTPGALSPGKGPT